MRRLVLASASPRRKHLLEAAGFELRVCPPALHEERLPGEGAEAFVKRLANDKARAVAALFPESVILGADTIVVAPGGQIMGKPADLHEARRMLGLLSGKESQVLTGVCLLRDRPAAGETWVCTTRVFFRDLTGEIIAEYLRRVHVLDKAGSYAIQEHGDLIIRKIQGLKSNVIGLPVEEVVERLAGFDEILNADSGKCPPRKTKRPTG